MNVPRIAAFRLGIGLFQGLLLLGLYQASSRTIWPATNGPLYASLLAVAIFVPTLTLSGLGNLRPRTLLIWIFVATLLCAGLAAYDILREPYTLVGKPPVPRIVPFVTTWFALAGCLFILHTLTVAGDAERRWVASYARHFDVAWKHGVQFALAVAFVGALWALLFLGAELFSLIHIGFLQRLVRAERFSIPVSALAFSAAVHVTDVSANIVRGTRTLALVLLAWLLPLMAAIAVAFIAALPFTGLAPLWATKSASVILLVAAAVLIFLINVAHQDGHAEGRAVAVIDYAKLLATAALIPLVALAAYALALRVIQYGWVPRRVIALACIVIAAFYAIGYAIAAVRSRRSMRGLELTNIVAALASVGVVLVLTTPLGDPARIAVNDQVRRLVDGKVTADKFDFAFLRFHAASFGTAALKRLAAASDGPKAAAAAERARAALAADFPMQVAIGKVRLMPEMLAHNIKVVQPVGATLPDTFLRQDWQSVKPEYSLPSCLLRDLPCEAVLTDLDGDGEPEIVLLRGGGGGAFKLADGRWGLLGTLGNAGCPGAHEALRAGQFEVEVPLLKDIVAAGQRLRVERGCRPGGPLPQGGRAGMQTAPQPR